MIKVLIIQYVKFNPLLIFRGLDSSSSFAVMKALSVVASNTNMTICCVIHQPRFEILSKFSEGNGR